MQASKIKTVATILAYIAGILILVAVVGLVYRFTNGFNEDFKTFYIEQDGKQILSSSSTMSFKADTTYRFDVKYTFDTEQSEPKDYSVKVIPNVGRDFDFTVDGERYLYSKQGELSAAFALNKQDTYFEISTKTEMSLQNVLQSCYPGKEVIVPKEAEESNTYPYTLVVASYNESVVYKIDFCVGVKVTGVTLDPSEIIFTGSGEFDEEGQEPSVPAETYSIGYDTLGYGSVKSIAFHCQGTAKAGETVTFIIEVLDLSGEYEDYHPLEVTNVVLQNADDGTDIEDLEETSGVYSFVMPENDVTVMVYLMRID